MKNERNKKSSGHNLGPPGAVRSTILSPTSFLYSGNALSDAPPPFLMVDCLKEVEVIITLQSLSKWFDPNANINYVIDGKIGKYCYIHLKLWPSYLPSLGSFVPSLNLFVPSLNLFVPSLNSFVPSLNLFVPFLNSFVPSLGSFVPSLNSIVPYLNTILILNIF